MLLVLGDVLVQVRMHHKMCSELYKTHLELFRVVGLCQGPFNKQAMILVIPCIAHILNNFSGTQMEKNIIILHYQITEFGYYDE